MINERYKIVNELGSGRSRVFLCTDAFLSDKKFAIKILPKSVSEDELDAFKNEYYLLTSFDHPNILNAFESGTVVKLSKDDSKLGIEAGSKFITLEYIDGCGLLDFPGIEKQAVLEEVIKQICSVLFYLHQSCYIYYDLKPENIIVEKYDGAPKLKFIDFGFARYYPHVDDSELRGTAEYIAPEILKKEFVDHRADLYSLGIMLYQIIYDRFPFETKNELEIYKAHISGKFEFPVSNYSSPLIKIVKNLLNRDPSERYYTSLEILAELNIQISDELKSEWKGVSQFAGRNNAIAAVDRYLSGGDLGSVLSIRGTEGSGKTKLLKEIEKNAQRTLILKNYPSSKNYEFWQVVLKQFLYKDFIYSNLDESTLEDVNLLISNGESNIVETVKAVLLQITQDNDFIILIDDINLYDQFSLLLLKQVILVLQVNNIKIIVTENPDHELISSGISNCQIFHMTPFSETDVEALLESAYAGFFPKNEITELILKHSDLLPGSIVSFITDLIGLEIIEYGYEGPTITTIAAKYSALENYHKNIYKLRLHKLSDAESSFCQLLAVLELKLNRTILENLSGNKGSDLDRILISLKDKNVLSNDDLLSSPEFSAVGLKNYIYSKVENVKKQHLKTAKNLERFSPESNLTELARQYELGEDYKRCYQVYQKELQKAESNSAYSYQQSLLNHLLELPLSNDKLTETKIALARVLSQKDDSKESIDLINNLLAEDLDDYAKLNLEILKGSCQIKLGNLKEGIKIIRSRIDELRDEKEKLALMIDIAAAEFDLGNYDAAELHVKNVINDPSAKKESVGRGYTILGLIEIYKNNNMDNAIIELNNAAHIFEKANIKSRLAGIHLNLGNIFVMTGANDKAEEHWDFAVKLNMSVGNLEQEAYIQLNYGIYRYYQLKTESAIKQYKRALNIFNSTGNLNGQGLVLSNLGEVYMLICEYQLAFDSLQKSLALFKRTGNIEEQAQVLFHICKFYDAISDQDEFLSSLNSFEDFVNKNDLAEKYNPYLSMIKQLLIISKDLKTVSLEKLITARNFFLEEGKTIDYAYLTLLIAKIHADKKEFTYAIKELNDDNFNKLCKENKLLFAEREFIFGIIASFEKVLDLKTSVEHFENAYCSIENESITELTWKVLFELANYYVQRGNLNKAKEYVIYSKTLIDFISEKIKDLKIKNAYLSQKERLAAIEKLEQYHKRY